MAMSEDQIREAMRRSFSAYATVTRRASIVLGGRLAVAKAEAELAKLPPEDFEAIAREEAALADRRMASDATALHPVVPFLSEVQS